MSSHLPKLANTFAAAALSMCIVGCTNTPATATEAPASAASSSATVPDQSPPPPVANPEPAGSCDASKGSWAVGKVADEALQAKVLSDTGAKHMRFLKPGMMITAEFDGNRVNVRVDNDKIVLSVACG
jgi:hypothetical protein